MAVQNKFTINACQPDRHLAKHAMTFSMKRTLALVEIANRNG